MRALKDTRGFTLIEMLVALAIMGLLTRLAAPSFLSFIAEARLTSGSEGVAGALNYARSEAGMRSAPIVIIPAASGWQGGLSVKSSAGVELRQVGRMAASVSLTGPVSSMTKITFYPDGSTDLGGSAWMRFCDSNAGSVGRYISINGSGYITTSMTLATGGSGATAACP